MVDPSANPPQDLEPESPQKRGNRRESAFPAQASEFPNTYILDSDSWGPSLEEKFRSIQEPLVLFAPLGLPTSMVRRCLQEWEKETNLDGMTFFREGLSQPLGLRLIRKCILQPICWLLEIPGQREKGWLGWSNQVGEWVGSWWFGVGNRDPFFPLRILKTDLLKELCWQSHGDMFFLEMLAKVHFLGGRLMEKPIPPGLGAEKLIFREPCWSREAWDLAMSPQFRIGPNFPQTEIPKGVG